MHFDAKRARPMRNLPPPRVRNGVVSDFYATSRHRSHAARHLPHHDLQLISEPSSSFPNITYDPSRDLSYLNNNRRSPVDPVQPLSTPAPWFTGEDTAGTDFDRDAPGPAVFGHGRSPSPSPSRTHMLVPGASRSLPNRMWPGEPHQTASRHNRSYTAIIDDIMSGSLGAVGSSSNGSTRRGRGDEGEGNDGGRRVRQRLHDATTDSDHERQSYPWRDNRRDGVVFEDAPEGSSSLPETNAGDPPARWFIDAAWDANSPFASHAPRDPDFGLDEHGYMTYIPWSDDTDLSTII